MAASRRRFQLSSILTPLFNFIGTTEATTPPTTPPATESTPGSTPKASETKEVMPTTENGPTVKANDAPSAIIESEKTEDVVKPQEPGRTLFSVYCTTEMGVIDRKMTRLTSLSSTEQEILREYSTRLQSLAVCINANGKFLHSIMKHGEMLLKNAFDDESNINNTTQEIRELFTSIARDWSSTGIELREMIYKPIVEAINHSYEEYSTIEEKITKSKYRIMVSNAGTGRLCWELANSGYSVEGCEYSSIYLATSNYMLNHASKEASHEIFPNIHNHSNVKDSSSMVKPSTVPDITARSLINSNIEFGMRIGNCIDVYSNNSSNSSFDAVVSCLIDEFDENIVLNIRTISNILRPGGVWVFLGPKPQPHDDSSLSLTLSIPEFVSLVKRSGFKILSERTIPIPLTLDNSSMCTRTISAKLFTAMKVRPMK